MKILFNSKPSTTFFAMALCSLICGCQGGSRPYIGPEGGDRARIRLSTDGSIRILPNTRCVNWRLPNIGMGPVESLAPLDNSNNGKKIGMPGTAPSGLKTAELYLKAEEPVLIYYLKHAGAESAVYGQITMKYCSGVFAFTPKADTDYVGFFHVAPDREHCIRGVAELNNVSVSVTNEYQRVCLMP